MNLKINDWVIFALIDYDWKLGDYPLLFGKIIGFNLPDMVMIKLTTQKDYCIIGNHQIREIIT